jgi:hypothetical protein
MKGPVPGGTQVLFDGIAAPILFARTDVVNTAIPCALAGHASTEMTVEYLGPQSTPFTLTLTDAAPGVFTQDASGRGPAVILNQGYSENSPANPRGMDSLVLGDIELDGHEALVGDGDRRRIAGTGVDPCGSRRAQRIRACSSEAAIRARDQGNGVLDVHNSF